MQLPIVVLGHALVPVLLKHGVGYLDDAFPYDMIGRTDPFMPAGTAGECAWYTIYVTTTHFEVTVVLRVTPRIDGIALPSKDIVLNAVLDPSGERRITEIDLSVPHIVNTVERLRNVPRGTWCDVTVETVLGVGLGVSARQIVDGIEVEFEIVQEGRAAI